MINSIFFCKTPYKIKIGDGINTIIFESDNEREVLAIKQYFTGIWEADIIKKIEDYSEFISIIKSFRINNFTAVFESISFSYLNSIFYDNQDGYCYSDDLYYIVSRKTKHGITIYNRKTKEIFYLRPDDFIENIHLSQLIKEPLNCYRKASGYVLLHCSAYINNNKAVVFPAQKGAGKSTLLMGMLNLGGMYLANDSLFVYVQEGKILSKKNPHCIRLGNETIKYNQILNSYFGEEVNCNVSKMLDNSIIYNGKYQIIPSTLKNIYNRDCIAPDNIEVSNFIFPKLTVDESNYSIYEISKDEMQIRLRDSIGDRDHRICWLPFYDEDYLYKLESKVVDDLINCVDFSSYVLEYSGDAERIGIILNNKLSKNY